MSTDDHASPPARPNGALTALYLGLFAAAWFSWADSTAPDGLSVFLRVGAYAALALALAGLIRALVRRSDQGRRDRSADRKYLVIVLIEFAVAGAGAVLLGATDFAAYVPAFVAVVVGLHFLPLARLLHDPLLVPLGIVTAVVGVIAGVVEAVTATAAGTVAGTGVGVLLLGFGAFRWVRSVKTETKKA